MDKKQKKLVYWYENGYTLIEILLVISIITLLSSVVLSSYKTVKLSSRDATRKVNATQVSKALELHYFSEGKYPSGTFYSGWDLGAYPDSDGSCWCKDINDPEQLELKKALVGSGLLSKLPQDPIPKEGGQFLYDGVGKGFYYSSNGQSYVLGTYLENSEFVPPPYNTESLCSAAGNFQISPGSLVPSPCPVPCRGELLPPGSSCRPLPVSR